MRLSLKYRWNKLRYLLRHVFLMAFSYLFNGQVRKQIKDVKSIPIIIISFNQLHFLRQLVDSLLSMGYQNIVVVDNNSTYKPLLDYLNEIKSKVKVHFLAENKGHLAFWYSPELLGKYGKGFYVVTDPDIMPIEECPSDFLKTMLQLLFKAYNRTKVGFSLKLDDLPESNPNKENIIAWESKYHKVKIASNAFKAEIDTTFALYKPGYRYKLKDFTKAWRTAFPIQARHGGWYIDLANLTEEQQYYMKTANASASWKIDPEGKLVNEKHKTIYSKDD